MIDDKDRSFFANYIKAFSAWINQCQHTKLQS